MRASPVKTRSKDDLRAEAMRDLKVSKSSFDEAWIGAIEELGYHDWYEPLRKGRRSANYFGFALLAASSALFRISAPLPFS
jgi:hypothetical protein